MRTCIAIVTVISLLLIPSGCAATPGVATPTPAPSTSATAAPTATQAPTNSPTATPTLTPIPTLAPTPATAVTLIPTKTPLSVPAHYVDPREGNESIDVISGWYVAQEGDWVYYQNRAKGNTLYKMKSDGTQSTRLNTDIPLCINVVNGWIYYIAQNAGGALYRVRTDGSARARVVADSSYNVLVLGDWIYFTINYYNGTDNSLWRIRTNGTGKTQMTTVQTNRIVIEGSWIHCLENPYIEGAQRDYYYMMHLDGTGKSNMYDRMAYYRHGWYYEDGSPLKRSTSGRLEHSIIHLGRTIFIDVASDWVYFIDVDDSMYLHRIRTDGSSETALNAEAVVEGIVLNGWIYYITALEGGDLVRVRIDGTERQVMQ